MTNLSVAVPPGTAVTKDRVWDPGEEQSTVSTLGPPTLVSNLFPDCHHHVLCTDHYLYSSQNILNLYKNVFSWPEPGNLEHLWFSWTRAQYSINIFLEFIIIISRERIYFNVLYVGINTIALFSFAVFTNMRSMNVRCLTAIL